eukprot:6630976-Prymnesium_polylepis.1
MLAIISGQIGSSHLSGGIVWGLSLACVAWQERARAVDTGKRVLGKDSYHTIHILGWDTHL